MRVARIEAAKKHLTFGPISLLPILGRDGSISPEVDRADSLAELRDDAGLVEGWGGKMFPWAVNTKTNCPFIYF